MPITIKNSAGGGITLDSTTSNNETVNLPTGGGNLITTTGATFTGNIATKGITSVTLGNNNFVAGASAGGNIRSGGNNNTLVGYQAGITRTTGSSNVCIGYQAGHDGLTASNLLFIARSNTGPSNAATWIFGDGSGACRQGNNLTTWTQTSDERIKKNIVDSPNGLAKIDALQVRNFNYRTEAEITVSGLTGCDATGLQVGVIAQEIETVLPEAVSEGEGGQKQVQTDPIFWSMVKAIQELSARIKVLEGE